MKLLTLRLEHPAGWICAHYKSYNYYYYYCKTTNEQKKGEFGKDNCNGLWMQKKSPRPINVMPKGRQGDAPQLILYGCPKPRLNKVQTPEPLNLAWSYQTGELFHYDGGST